MGLLEKTSTPASKRCRLCGERKPLSSFSPFKEMRDGYRNECHQCRYTFYGKPYRQSEGGKAWRRQYEASEDYRAKRRSFDRWYHKTEKYRDWMHNYRHTSLTYKRTKAMQDKRYAMRHPEQINANSLARYYRIQDEAGYHHAFISEWYPAYRFLKSLEEAEVVTIEG